LSFKAIFCFINTNDPQISPYCICRQMLPVSGNLSNEREVVLKIKTKFAQLCNPGRRKTSLMWLGSI
jgi:hypothetical protein